jgi:hypothetical protein
VKLVLCASLLLLAGALSVTGSLAAEAAPRAKPAASPSAKAADHEALRHGDTGKDGHEHAVEGSPGAAAGKEAPIDTRITVQPRTTKKSPLGSAKSAIAPLARPMSPPRQTIAPETGSPSRNAIGIPLDQHANTPGGSAALPHGSTARSTSPTSPKSGSAIHASTNPALAGTRLQNGAAVTGTGVSRPGSGPGTLGGPAKNVAIISGTNIRPKR